MDVNSLRYWLANHRIKKYTRHNIPPKFFTQSNLFNCFSKKFYLKNKKILLVGYMKRKEKLMATSSFEIFEDKKLYKASEIKKLMGISERLWKGFKEDLPYAVIGEETPRARRYYSGKDLNKWLVMQQAWIFFFIRTIWVT